MTDHQSQISARLRDMAADTPVPDASAMEARLLQAFAEAQRRRTPRYWQTASMWAAAALLVIAGTLVWHLARFREGSIEPSADRDATVMEFVAVPGAATLPDFESGRIVRVHVPLAVLPAYGLEMVPDASGAPIEADLLVGQDGLARGIRLISTTSTDRSQR
jgi:hypothetical protein